MNSLENTPRPKSQKSKLESKTSQKNGIISWFKSSIILCFIFCLVIAGLYFGNKFYSPSDPNEKPKTAEREGEQVESNSSDNLSSQENFSGQEEEIEDKSLSEEDQTNFTEIITTSDSENHEKETEQAENNPSLEEFPLEKEPAREDQKKKPTSQEKNAQYDAISERIDQAITSELVDAETANIAELHDDLLTGGRTRKNLTNCQALRKAELILNRTSAEIKSEEFWIYPEPTPLPLREENQTKRKINGIKFYFCRVKNCSAPVEKKQEYCLRHSCWNCSKLVAGFKNKETKFCVPCLLAQIKSEEILKKFAEERNQETETVHESEEEDSQSSAESEEEEFTVNPTRIQPISNYSEQLNKFQQIHHEQGRKKILAIREKNIHWERFQAQTEIEAQLGSLSENELPPEYQNYPEKIAQMSVAELDSFSQSIIREINQLRATKFATQTDLARSEQDQHNQAIRTRQEAILNSLLEFVTDNPEPSHNLTLTDWIEQYFDNCGEDCFLSLDLTTSYSAWQLLPAIVEDFTKQSWTEFLTDHSELTENYQKYCDYQENKRWQKIHPDFNQKTRLEWEQQGFTYETAKEWINTDDRFTPYNYGFCVWLRDKKKTTAEEANYVDLNEFMVEYLAEGDLEASQQEKEQEFQELKEKIVDLEKKLNNLTTIGEKNKQLQEENTIALNNIKELNQTLHSKENELSELNKDLASTNNYLEQKTEEFNEEKKQIVDEKNKTDSESEEAKELFVSWFRSGEFTLSEAKKLIEEDLAEKLLMDSTEIY